jgi:hypothetical protein
MVHLAQFPLNLEHRSRVLPVRPNTTKKRNIKWLTPFCRLLPDWSFSAGRHGWEPYRHRNTSRKPEKLVTPCQDG